MGINSPGMISGIMSVMLSILLCLFIHGDPSRPYSYMISVIYCWGIYFSFLFFSLCMYSY